MALPLGTGINADYFLSLSLNPAPPLMTLDVTLGVRPFRLGRDTRKLKAPGKPLLNADGLVQGAENCISQDASW